MKKFITLLLLLISIYISPCAIAEVNVPELKLSSWKEGETIISWNLIKEASYYNIYGGETPASATINPANRIASTSIQFYIDENKHNSHAYYIVTAVNKDDIESQESNLISLRGKLWVNRNSGTNSTLNKIIFINDKFFTVGENGTLITSLDGNTWTAQDTHTNEILLSIAFGNNKLIAVGGNGTMISSSDGTLWETEASMVEKNLYKIIFANDKFITTGDSGTILTSTDGVKWVQHTTGITSDWSNTLFVNNQIFAIFNNNMLVSTDGINWTTHTINDIKNLYKIIYVNDKFVAIGSSDKAEGIILTSSDGAEWKQVYKNPYNLYTLNFIKNQFIITDSNGAILTSTDGINWAKQLNTLTSRQFNTIIWADNQFVNIGVNNEGSTIFTSPDGMTWTKQLNKNKTYLYDIIFANHKFVTVGWGGTIITSP